MINIATLIGCFNEVRDYKISERMCIVEATFSTVKNSIPNFNTIRSLLSGFPIRDKVTIEICNCFSDSIQITNYEVYEQQKYDEFYDELDEIEEVNISIEIIKNIEDMTISIYDFRSFKNEILNDGLIRVIDSFCNVLRRQPYLVFEMFDNNEQFGTRSILFRPVAPSRTTIEFNRLERLEQCKINSYFYNINEISLLPDDFHITSSYVGNPFENIFGILETIFSMVYISNSSSIDGESFHIQITGQKNITKTYSIFPTNSMNICNNKEFYTIYSWIYTDGNPTDKMIIARNIISLHCNYTDLLQLDNKTFASICSNYALYQKNNVEKYLELKGQLSEYIMTLSKQIGEIIVDLTQRVKNNLIAFFTFIISAIFANLASSAQLDNIFTNQVVAIVNIILLGSVVYMVISVYEINMMIDNLDKGYKELKNRYDGLLDTIDIEEIFGNDEFKDKSIKETRKKRNIIIVVWIAMIILIAIVTNSYNKPAHNMDEVKISNEQTTSSTLQIKE